ncbi:MAG: hypothetical protein ACI9GH_000330 [Candidatus Paceibacteria bacterium]|jgi:hypothetical protein
MDQNKKTLIITLSILAFLLLSAGGVAYAASEEGFHKMNLTEEQKEVLEEARELKEEGDLKGARELIKESGIVFPKKHHKYSEELMEKHEDIREAVENGDYDLFLELTEDSPRHIEINEDTFNRLVEAHALRQAGDHEGAREIMEELGLDKHPRFGGHHGEKDHDDDNEDDNE